LKKLLALAAAAGLVYAVSQHAVTAGAAGHLSTAGYVNPLAGQQWIPGRTDQGVDYKPAVPEPVRAIGPGIVVFSSTADCLPHGWPGCAMISYRLTWGPAEGSIVYVAEHLKNLLPEGARVSAGMGIAIALPGFPGTEWGWAACDGKTPAVRYGGAPDGTPMAGGLAFARFMRSLGAGSAQDPGRGPGMVKSCPAGGGR
jgi:hypothetical protein